jgi:hypothetical protein
MITTTIPLSQDYTQLNSYLVTAYGSNAFVDASSGSRILGFLSGYRINLNNSTYFVKDLRSLHNLDLRLPVYKNSLVSAFVSFTVLDNFPLGEVVSGSVPIDARTEYTNYASRNNIYLGFSTNADAHRPISNFYDWNTFNKTNSVKYFVNGNNTTYTLSITDIVAPHVNSSNWIKNNSIHLFFSGIPSGSGSVGIMPVSSFNLILNYEAVPPFQPTNILVNETAYKQATINWTPPSDNGGLNISSYNLQYGNISGNNNFISNWQDIGTTSNTFFIVDNLELDKEYVFRVAAKNASGLGQYSSQSVPIVMSKELAPITSLSFNDSNPIRIRLRRDIRSAWSGINPILALGEAGYELDTYRLKVGNGTGTWNSLPYIRVDNSSISFPPAPDVYLTISSSTTNSSDQNRMVLNLSDGDRLNIVGEEGIAISYNDNYKLVKITTDKLYNPILSGTIYNPTSSGTAGSLLYDSEWLYFCVKPNFWQRSPIDKNWLNFSQLMVSNVEGSYPSNTTLMFDKNLARLTTDGDPYPALAGRPLTNSGSRIGFKDNASISDQLYQILFTYRAGSNTHNPMPITPFDIHGFTNNGVMILSCTAGSGSPPGFVSAPSGFTYNAIGVSNMFVIDDCGGTVDIFGKYLYRDGRFLSNCWNTSKFYSANSYYNGSNYSGNYFRHPNGHSKILGFCLDGYPIYGPFAYSDPINSVSSIIQMTSSYSGLLDDSHRPINWKFWNKVSVGDTEYSLPFGLFDQDFTFVSGYGTLDQYNGRFAVTPEFPSGTYAYYTTFSDEALQIPAYPYIFGRSTKQQRQIS